MSLLHMSIAAADPARAARVLAQALGGRALSFPPCPGAWIAFTAADDGSAIEVYPGDARIERGPETIAFVADRPDSAPSFAHLAIATPLAPEAVLEIGAAEGWTTRICNRGPFDCVEMWVENRILIEFLSPGMQADYATGMTYANWRAMFGLKEEED